MVIILTMSKSTRKSDKLQLATAITNLSAKQEAFIKSIEALENFKSENLRDLDTELSTKRDELDNIEKEYKHKQKDMEIEADQYINEYKYKGAKKILDEYNEEPINCNSLEEMREEIKTLKEDRQQEIDDVIAKEQDKCDKQLKAILSNTDLKHKAESAGLAAEVNQQKREIEMMKETIESLKDEVREQRKLTKEVAEAGRQGAVTVNSGKT